MTARKPSVTQLIDQLDKPALVRWANKQGLLGIDIDAERKRAKAAGTSLHAQVEKVEFEDPLHAHQFAQFMADKEVLKREQRIETQWFVGRFDAKIRYKDLDWLIDYKIGSRLYFETKLQLVAYGMAEPCDRFAMVTMPDFVLIDAQIGPDKARYEEIIISLSAIYQMRREIEA